MVDYYNLLGVPPRASAAEVRRAFRARAKAVHPDAHPDVEPAEREALRRRFILLAQAYETLSDPARRAVYDRSRPAAGARPARGASGGRETAGAGSARWRSTQARFGQARRPPPPPPPGGESLEDLLRDVESLLGRFGLDLRQPFEALLEALLDWARGVFRQVLGADEPPHAAASAGSGTAGATRGAPPRGAGRDSRAQPHSAAAADAAWVEAELATLRRHVRRRGSARPTEDVEAELRRLKERLGRSR